jgi:D-beta-D-heptose 7-phosphate kinase/D-beta-D-heptose 1-phosphate adenosyltransferase
MSLRPEISPSEDYVQTANKIREYGKAKIPGGYQRIVFLNGCFDVLHIGHMKTISHARDLAGHFGAVIIGLNDDDSVKRLKGPTRPIFDHESRAMMLIYMRYVDHVITFSEDTPLELISALKPDVLVKGGDYKAEDVVGNSIVPLVSIAPYDKRWSTTNIVEEVKQSGRKQKKSPSVRGRDDRQVHVRKQP